MFREITLQEASLSASELDIFEHFDTSTDYTAVTLVRIEGLDTFQENGFFSFAIPSRETLDTFIVEVSRVEWIDNGNYAWGGIIGASEGSFTFMKKPEGEIATIHLPGGSTYHLIPIKPGIGVLLKNSQKIGAGSCEILEELEEIPESECTYNECPAVITVLLLITPRGYSNLMNQVGGNSWLYTLRLFFMEFYINTIFLNSGIANKSINIITQNFGYNSPSALSMSEVLENIPDNTGNFYRNVRLERSINNADLTFVIDSDNSWNNGILGIAFIGPNASTAYSVIHAQYLWNPRVFPHELGHLFGGRHEWENDDTPVCGHAWNAIGKTIIWSKITGAGEIPFFSNPDLGTGNYSNPTAQNAQQIMSSGCAVSKYFDTQDWVIAIEGNNPPCDNDPATFSVNINTPPLGVLGQPPYQYEWRWSSSGFFTTQNPGIYLGSDSIVVIGSLDCPYFFLQVRVISSDSEIRYATKKIRTLYRCPECPDIVARKRGNTFQLQTTEVNTLQVFPNPISDLIRIRYETPVSEEIQLSIFDIKGQLIEHISNEIAEAGLYQKQHALKNIIAGYYIVRLKSPHFVKYQKVFISK